MAHGLEEELVRSWPPARWQRRVVVVAVSGGPDSVALLRALHQLATGQPQPARLIAAHYNHGWRQQAAADDESFVEDLAKKLQVELRTGRGKPPATGHGIGWEAVARRERYQFLLSVAQQQGARHVATGHTADDQLETVLWRILRGTGIEGLRGMPRARSLGPGVDLVRPLLHVRRTTILSYLEALGQSWREDASNRSPDFTRSRLRAELLPMLRSRFNPDVDDALLRLAALAQETSELLTTLSAPLICENQWTERDGAVYVERSPLVSWPSSILRHYLRRLWTTHGWPQRNMSWRRWHELSHVVLAPPPQRRHFPGGVLVETTAAEIRFAPPEA